MEHIQSKLLTEYGELRAAVSEVGRNTLELSKDPTCLAFVLVGVEGDPIWG